MPFDPDAYIANLPKAEPANTFDPDAYIKSKGLTTASVEAAPPTPKKEEPGFFRRAAASFGNALSTVGNVGSDVIHTHGAALLDPAKRHALERGIADVVTGGLATKAAEHFGFPTPQQEPENPDYRAAGSIGGAFLPSPFSALGGAVAGKALGPLAAQTTGKAAGAAIGAAKGAVGYEASAIPLAVTQAAAEGLNPIEAARQASIDPLGLTLGIGIGSATGAAHGKANAIRDTGTMSGRTLAAINAAGGEIGPTGVKGGLYETPGLENLPKGRAGVNELAQQTQGEMLTHGRGKLANARSQYEAEMAQVLGENGTKPVVAAEAHSALNAMEAANTTFDGKVLDPGKAKFINDMRDVLSSQQEMDVPQEYTTPPRGKTPQPRFPQWPLPESSMSEEPTTKPGIQTRISGTPEPTIKAPPVKINDIQVETPGGIPWSEVPDLNLSEGMSPSPFGRTAAAEPSPYSSKVTVTVPEVTAEDLIKVKKFLTNKADWNNPATPETHHYREVYKALAKDAEAIDPRIAVINKKYGSTMEGLKRVNDILFGKNSADVADRAASEKRAALKLGRVGDETQAATSEANQIEELRRADPEYARMLRLMEAKKAQERSRFGEPQLSTGFEQGQHRAAGHGATRLGLGALGAKVGSVLGPPGTVAGAAVGAGAANLLRNPVATDLRIKLPVANYIAGKKGLAPGLAAVEEARAEQRRKEAERINTVLGGLNLTQANPHQPMAYVDRIEGDKAVLVDDAGNSHNIDVSALPKGAKAGAWIQGNAVVPPPPSQSEAIRKRLSAGDTGGNFAL